MVIVFNFLYSGKTTYKGINTASSFYFTRALLRYILFREKKKIVLSSVDEFKTQAGQ